MKKLSGWRRSSLGDKRIPFCIDEGSDDENTIVENNTRNGDIDIVKLSISEGSMYRELMRQEDVNHTIIVGGFLCWKDIVNCMCVCKEWKEIIGCSSAFDMFLHGVLDELDKRHSVICKSESEDGKRFHNVTSTDLKRIKEFLSFSMLLKRWHDKSCFSYDTRMIVGGATKVLDFMSIGPNSEIGLGETIQIPSTYQGTDLWFELTDPSWNQDENDEFGFLMAFQNRFQYSYTFFCIPYMKGMFYRIEGMCTNITNKHMQGKFQEQDEKELPRYGRFRSSSSTSAEILSISEFELGKLSEDFVIEFHSITEKLDTSTNLEFNTYLRKMLCKVWKSGFLYYSPVRDYILQLLFLFVDGKIYDYHRFSFQNKPAQSDENVTNTVKSIISSAQNGSETLFSYLEVKKPCSGYSGGQSVSYYFLALTLKQSPTRVDECEYEFVRYFYYSNSVRGIALS